MTETRFTPGPLAIREGNSVVNVIDTYGRRIATFSTAEYWERFNPEDLANATLYMAAPELYEALEKSAHALETIAAKLDEVGQLPLADILRAGAKEQRAALSRARGEAGSE